ncbi:MAG: alanine racemase [Oscillospiraceae bacterium]|nr:alanine racemase [Oscillospiraceae bacterium]
MDYLKRAWAEIHLDAIAHNYKAYKELIGDGTEIMCVVKADCYGHCDRAIVPYLENELGVRKFAVSNIEEAQRLRDSGVKGDILILGYTPPEAARRLFELDIIQAVTELPYAKELCGFLGDGEKLRVHVAIDTGMTRIGIHSESIDEIASDMLSILSMPALSVEGMFTHLCVADSDDEGDVEYTKAQIEKLMSVVDKLKERGQTIPCVHYLNSAAGVYHDRTRSDLARLGIILYGLMPNASLPVPIKLESALSLKARVAQVKEIKAGECVSYGRTFVAPRDMKLATIAIGYADGYSRLLSGKGEILINGKRAKIAGRVCMDQLMCDVTGIDVKANDIATLIGKDGDDCITADELAAIYGTIGYEVVCGISKRVPRVIIKDGVEITAL